MKHLPFGRCFLYGDESLDDPQEPRYRVCIAMRKDMLV
ncbi:MAG: hypothetical protein UU08_C0002G0046 [Candidatus Uhrbacteria bacterium GW2011_GWE2_40_58]|nr:MAG: hypothetical protein UT94_C0003G0030 [Candidatus Uhrbacteria bacterium GW2011_GWF2_40_263]KKR68195.1 MAG: hypothetical protein UU08_C0002G0046 [Candidatus Uhrbacteria bacterium GW2011_GWE2_40_58]